MNSFQESQVIWKHKFAFDTRLHNETRALTVYDRMILDTGLPGRVNGAILSNEKPIYPVNFQLLRCLFLVCPNLTIAHVNLPPNPGTRPVPREFTPREVRRWIPSKPIWRL